MKSLDCCSKKGGERAVILYPDTLMPPFSCNNVILKSGSNESGLGTKLGRGGI